MKTHDDFDNLYNQDTSILSEYFDNDGRLETFGKDQSMAFKMARKNFRKVWSCINDINDGIAFITGLHDGAIYYIITKEEWQNKNEVYTLELPKT